MATKEAGIKTNAPPRNSQHSPLINRPKSTPSTPHILDGFFQMKSILGIHYKRAMFVLLVLTICNIFVQIDIFLIGVTSKEMQIDQNWGNKDGTGTEYDFLAGPVFTFAHILAALPVGYLVDTGCISNALFLCLAMLIWSGSVVFTGYSTNYLQVVLCRVVLAMFTSCAGILCMSIISEFFPSEIRASACALWNFAIYIGFSAAYGAGNGVAEYFNNWRYTWWIFGYAGIAWSLLIILISKLKKTNIIGIHATNLSNTNVPTSDTEIHSDIDIGSQIDLTDEFVDNIHIKDDVDKINKIRMLGTIRSITRNDNMGYDDNRNRNDTATTMEYSRLDVLAMKNHQDIIYQMQQQQVTIGKVLWYLIKSPSLLLLIFASFYRNCGGYIWGYQADNYFVNETGDSNYTVALWLIWVPMVAGSIGCLLGGIISDKLARPSSVTPQNLEHCQMLVGRTIIRRIWVLVFANLLSFPFAAGVLILDSPYCYLSLFGMYIFSEMWISVVITLLIEFSPQNMRTSMLSIYYFSMGLAGFAPLMVTVVTKWIKSYKWSMFILFPCIYGTSSILFFFVIFTYKRDLKKKGIYSMLNYAYNHY